jgi:hypothetical protein
MSMVTRFLLNILLLCAVPAYASGTTFSCARGIVSAGDTAVDLIVKCGEPDWKDSHQEEVTDRIDRNFRHTTYITVEEWTYNLGPQQFMRIITIKNGRITRIRTGQYGTPRDREPPGPYCDDRIISKGDTKVDVLTKCGEPFHKESHEEEIREWLDGTASRTVSVTVEEWTYNFGPNRFMRIYTFRNGKVVDIRTGGYGTTTK